MKTDIESGFLVKTPKSIIYVSGDKSAREEEEETKMIGDLVLRVVGYENKQISEEEFAT